METRALDASSDQPRCPICGGQGYHLYGTFQVCPCGVVFQDYSHIDQKVYDQSYHEKYVNARCEAAYRRATDLYVPVVESLTPGRRMLEIGAAVDVTLRAFRERGWQVTGSDINRHSRGDLPFVVGDFEKTDIEGPFDCVWASHVFEHFRDPLTALRKAGDLLSEDGALFIAMPDAGQLDFASPHTWGHLHEREHHILFSLARFADLAVEAGLAPVRMRVNTGPHDGFICWTDFHVLLVRQGHPATLEGCDFPRLPQPPRPPELTCCRWAGAEYELLPFDVDDADFWQKEARRLGISLPQTKSGVELKLEAVRREQFPFFRDPAESFLWTAAV